MKGRLSRLTDSIVAMSRSQALLRLAGLLAGAGLLFSLIGVAPEEGQFGTGVVTLGVVGTGLALLIIQTLFPDSDMGLVILLIAIGALGANPPVSLLHACVLAVLIAVAHLSWAWAGLTPAHGVLARSARRPLLLAGAAVVGISLALGLVVAVVSGALGTLALPGVLLGDGLIALAALAVLTAAVLLMPLED